MIHRTESYPTKETARAVSRRVRLARRVITEPRYCADCKGWHVVANDVRITDKDKLVIAKVAAGLRAHEIAVDTGETESQVVNRVKNAMAHFGALSRTNLCVVAIWLGVIDATPIVVSDERQA